jgi:uncharacterized protein YkwD
MEAILRAVVVLSLPVLSLFAGLEGVQAGMPAHHSAYAAGHRMLAIVNADRQAAGLAPLSFDCHEASVAKQHSRDMAVHHYFSHTSEAGTSPFDRLHEAGITYHVAGENLGMDQGTNRTAMMQAIDVAMMHSPEHRANLLRATFTHVGIGVTYYSGVLYITEDFTG